MPGMPPRRSPSLSSRAALRAALLAGGLTISAGGPADCRGGDHHHRCGPGCEPNCPVRPGHFGFYETHWRRWPGAGPTAAGTSGAATPAAPPRSVVPGADEESPQRPDEPRPAPATGADDAPLPAPPESGARDGRRDRGRLIADLTTGFEAARAGGATSQAEFTRRLVPLMLSEDDPAIRAWIVELAAAFDAPESKAICSGALEDPDPRVRLVACTACARRIGPPAVPMLAARVRDDADLGVRLRALRALGDVEDDAALVAVAAALDDPDPAVRTRAVHVLRQRSGGRDFGTDVAAWRAWAADPRARSASASPLPEFLRRFF